MNALRYASRLAPRTMGRTSLLSSSNVTLFNNTSRWAGSEVAKVNPTKLDELGSVDHLYDTEYRADKVTEPERRAFTYLMISAGRLAYASTVRVIVVKLLSYLCPNAETLALAFTEFDLSELHMGTTATIMWRGKPVYIRRRTPTEIAQEEAVPMEYLRDQETDGSRCIKPEYMVVIGICPHLGCVPLPDAGEYGGWLCPCHGSHYDTSGRIRKGPSPLNLEVPPYKFIEENMIMLG